MRHPGLGFLLLGNIISMGRKKGGGCTINTAKQLLHEQRQLIFQGQIIPIIAKSLYEFVM